MKITDISIESNNIQFETLSKQEANVVVGGSIFSNITNKVKKDSSFATEATKINKHDAGVPGAGAIYDSSCFFW